MSPRAATRHSAAGLIPHAPPMRLLDNVWLANDQQLLATVALHDASPFYVASGLPACIGLEYLGQATAAFFTLRQQIASSISETPVTARPGMLVSSRSYDCQHGFFPVPATLLVDVQPKSAPGAGTLTKFVGHIDVLAEQPPLETEVQSLLELQKQARSETDTSFASGDLSVYLPPSND